MSKINLITVCKTLKKEGRAFRDISIFGNKKYIFPTVKSAMLLLFDISTYS